MRVTVVLACLALSGLLAAAPASADVTVDESLPGNCRGTYGAQAGPWGEAWVGSGHPTAAGSCRLHVFVDTPDVAPTCVGYTYSFCTAGANPDCDAASVVYETPRTGRSTVLCLSPY